MPSRLTASRGAPVVPENRPEETILRYDLEADQIHTTHSKQGGRPNEPLERPGINRRGDCFGVGVGRSASALGLSP